MAIAAVAGVFIFFPVSYDRQLVDGYRLFKAGSTDVAIVDPKGFGVAGVTVTSVGVVGDYIVGEVRHPTPGSYYPHADDQPGYFAINRRTTEVSRGMSLEQLTAFCESKGIARPSLTNPDHWWMKW